MSYTGLGEKEEAPVRWSYDRAPNSRTYRSSHECLSWSEYCWYLLRYAYGPVKRGGPIWRESVSVSVNLVTILVCFCIWALAFT